MSDIGSSIGNNISNNTSGNNDIVSGALSPLLTYDQHIFLHIFKMMPLSVHAIMGTTCRQQHQFYREHFCHVNAAHVDNLIYWCGHHIRDGDANKYTALMLSARYYLRALVDRRLPIYDCEDPGEWLEYAVDGGQEHAIGIMLDYPDIDLRHWGPKILTLAAGLSHDRSLRTLLESRYFVWYNSDKEVKNHSDAGTCPIGPSLVDAMLSECMGSVCDDALRYLLSQPGVGIIDTAYYACMCTINHYESSAIVFLSHPNSTDINYSDVFATAVSHYSLDVMRHLLSHHLQEITCGYDTLRGIMHIRDDQYIMALMDSKKFMNMWGGLQLLQMAGEIPHRERVAARLLSEPKIIVDCAMEFLKKTTLDRSKMRTIMYETLNIDKK